VSEIGNSFRYILFLFFSFSSFLSINFFIDAVTFLCGVISCVYVCVCCVCVVVVCRYMASVINL